MFERRLYEAFIMSMPEGNLNKEFKTTVWNLTIFQVMITLENKIQNRRRSPRKDGHFAWLHLIGYHQCYHLVCSNKSPTRCNNFPIYFPDVYLQLSMFRAFSRPSSGAQRLQQQPLVLPSYLGDSRAVVRGRVKPEAATAVVELLMMGEGTPETCSAVNKRQDNKLENCCICLEIYLNCTMMHGLTNLKFSLLSQ